MDRLRTTTISGSMPARRQALAVSYSQLVPGKTGMTALGRATLCLHTAMDRLSQEMGFTVFGGTRLGGVDTLQHAVVELEQLVNGHGLAAAGMTGGLIGLTDADGAGDR